MAPNAPPQAAQAEPLAELHAAKGKARRPRATAELQLNGQTVSLAPPKALPDPVRQAARKAERHRLRQAQKGASLPRLPHVEQLRPRKLNIQHIETVGRLLGCLALSDQRVLAFFGQGTPPSRFASHPQPNADNPTELREIAGATMVDLQRTDAQEPPPQPSAQPAPIRLALSDGLVLQLQPELEESAWLAGQNCLLGFRLNQSAAQILSWLRYHRDRFGMEAAVIVNRLPEPALIEALTTALDDDLHTGAPPLRVIWLDCPEPLGKADHGAEDHPYLAPDAPGKDRMTPPEPDAWRAPLGEGILYELMKWRFLSQARAVLNIDVTDYLANPPQDQPHSALFDRCLTAPGGVILLEGQRIYPWRVRAGHEASLADHITRPFDRRRPHLRWGVAPQKAGLQNSWRMTRISYARPDPSQSGHFWRAMAIKVPDRATSELAPKTALIEDPALLALSEGYFGHKPVRAPVSKMRSAAPAATDGGRTAIVTTMKNEAPFILEWLAWHRAIGVDDFLIYTNDCTDGTDHMLDLLQAKGLVQHRDNPFRESGLKPQHAALQAAEAEPIMQNCGWGICMDVDEFINIKIGDGTLSALYEAMGDANMIALTWRLFGNSDIHTYEDRFIIEQMSRCAPEIVRKPHQAWGFKTLFRNIDIYKKLGVHRPKGLNPDLWDQVNWLNGSGRALPREMFRNGWRSTLETYGYDWVQLNHYAVRSAESFLVKRDRGRVNHVERDQGANYWFRMNHNADEDRSIQRNLPRLQAEFDRLMADPEIAHAHHAAVAAHRAKIDALRQTPQFEAFYAELTGPRLETLCRLQQHFGSAVFAAGPHVIPQEIITPALPPDFFFTVDFTGEAAH